MPPITFLPIVHLKFYDRHRRDANTAVLSFRPSAHVRLSVLYHHMHLDGTTHGSAKHQVNHSSQR